ncbi:MAG: hypothetical protein ACTHJW_18905 [Streptosporangiaceae bacterium]
MDEVNNPRTLSDSGWPPAPPPQRPGQGAARTSAAGGVRRQRLGTMARWAIGLGAAVVLAGVSVLGVTLSGGSGGGAAHAAGAVLTGSGAPATGGSQGGAPAAAGASGFAASSGGQPGAAHAARARFHACIASARHLRATGHENAAKARLHSCLRRFFRMRAALIGRVRAREARLALLLRRGLHGQITVASKKGPKTIAFERGTVQSVSGSSVVVKAADGVAWTWQVGSETRLLRDGRKVGSGALQSGQRVAVLGLVTGGTNQARRVLIGVGGQGRS